MTDRVEVLVIGGGQAGLAASWHLNRAGTRHLVVDSSDAIGDSWRRRYDTLTLFTPRSLSALTGLELAGDQQGYAGRLEFADYLERYAVTNELPIMIRTRVGRLSTDQAGFVATLDNGAVIRARAVIDCTGAFQKPVVPALAKSFGRQIVQLDVGSYRDPIGIARGTALVVGDGASGRDIAVDLAGNLGDR